MGVGEAVAGAVTRRDLLRAGLAATALASVPALARSQPAFAAPSRAFASAAQLRDAQAALDRIGLRATASPAAPYVRPWVSALGVPAVLEHLRDAGAVGAIGILDAPAALANGSYFPYDGVLRGIPSLYVDRDTGAELRRAAAAGAPAHLTLD